MARHSAKMLLLRGITRIWGRPFEVHDRPRNVDAIVVLGAPIRPDGSLSEVCKERVALAMAHYQEGLASLVVFTGGAVKSEAEAPAMAAYAASLGLPEEHTLVEDRSRSTAENAAFTAALLRERGLRSVWIVSQPFQLRRGRRLFRRQGLDASACAPTRSVQYDHPELGLRWVAREYVAWIAHAVLPQHK